MWQLHPSKFGRVRALFDTRYPNFPVIYAIIERRILGRIWVNDEDNPTVCLIMTGTPYCFIKGRLNEEVLIACMKLLKQKQVVRLAVEPAPEIDLLKFGFTPIPRRQYTYQHAGNAALYENTSGFIVKKVEDGATLGLCGWKGLMVDFFGSAENFFKNGIGFILWDSENQAIASESYGILSKEFIEVGTITDENYRGRNLSTILCNHLIQWALQKKLQPVWTCDEANISSWKVAEKQGMDEMMGYTFYLLSE